MNFLKQKNMRINAKFFIMACILFLFPINTIAAESATLPPQSEDLEKRVMYLTEEDVLSAMAYTYQDTKLNRAMLDANTQEPLDSETYAEKIEPDFGGMFVDENGDLVLCYKEHSSALRKASLNNRENQTTLKNTSGETVAETVKIKTVRYSQTELLDTQNNMVSVMEEFPDIPSFYIDYEANKIHVTAKSQEAVKQYKEHMSSKIDVNMLEFFIMPNYSFEDTIGIHGTRNITNVVGVTGSTPAGVMYSSRFKCSGIITCGHGYSYADRVYDKTTGTKIGYIADVKYGNNNDSSFIILDSGHSYTSSDEIVTEVPVQGSYITLRGSISGTRSTKVKSTTYTFSSSGNKWTSTILVDYLVMPGDSGGGAVGGYMDGGRTAKVVGITKGKDSNGSCLIRGATVYNAHKN